MAPSKKARRKPRRKAAGGGNTPPHRFVGRDASPVLDRYPPKDPGLGVRGPPPSAAPSARATPVPPAASALPAAAPAAPATPAAGATLPLIRLERPFDVDEFSTLLGETSVRVTVPREDLAEVLRRVSEFMGFGIYVYAVTVRPAPTDLLKTFVVELQRVDYSPEKGDWVPFADKGTSDSPFGPTGHRT
jgi:hypothetical protein